VYIVRLKFGVGFLVEVGYQFLGVGVCGLYVGCVNQISSCFIMIIMLKISSPSL
jgi:hypothetical protein